MAAASVEPDWVDPLVFQRLYFPARTWYLHRICGWMDGMRCRIRYGGLITCHLQCNIDPACFPVYTSKT